MKQIALVIARRINSTMRTLRGSEGITLMELMIVIAIIGILSLVVVPRFMDIPKKARVEAAKQQIAAFGIALDRYNLDNGSYPTTEQGLEALVNKPNSEPSPMNYNEGGYLKEKKVPMDPWGKAYVYTSPGQNNNDYEIMSYGADGKEGGEGYNTDIKSWE